jgi:cytidine deaminase
MKGCEYMIPEELLKLAERARDMAYAPYSGFRVGAALLAASGKVYTGCNIENAAFTPTNCAERTAFFKAVSEGEREFAAIAVAGGKDREVSGPCTPCGVCRQVMMEFCAPGSFLIYISRGGGQYETYTLEQLLPKGFGKTNLDERN